MQSIRADIMHMTFCSLRGHTVSADDLNRLVARGKAQIEVKCKRCGDHLVISIDPDDDERYIYRAKY